MICKNCSHKVQGNYCSNCGQSTRVRRLTFRSLWAELLSILFPIGKGFFYTVKELFFRPNQTINNYIAGKRVNYFKPVSFILFTSTVYVLASQIFQSDTFMLDLINGYREGSNSFSSQKELSLVKWIAENQSFLFLLLSPVFALSSFLAFKRYSYNYIEHLVMNFYVTGIQLLIYFLFSFIQNRNSAIVLIPLILGFGYGVFAYNQIFSDLKLINRILRLSLTYVLFSFFFFFIITLIIGLSITVFPE